MIDQVHDSWRESFQANAIQSKNVYKRNGSILDNQFVFVQHSNPNHRLQNEIRFGCYCGGALLWCGM